MRPPTTCVCSSSGSSRRIALRGRTMADELANLPSPSSSLHVSLPSPLSAPLATYSTSPVVLWNHRPRPDDLGPPLGDWLDPQPPRLEPRHEALGSLPHVSRCTSHHVPFLLLVKRRTTGCESKEVVVDLPHFAPGTLPATRDSSTTEIADPTNSWPPPTLCCSTGPSTVSLQRQNGAPR